MDLRGKTSVVTGGASGIGRALALRFAREGANVVVGDLDTAAMEAVAAEARGLGVKALTMRTDVSELTQVEAAVMSDRNAPSALSSIEEPRSSRSNEHSFPGAAIGYTLENRWPAPEVNVTFTSPTVRPSSQVCAPSSADVGKPSSSIAPSAARAVSM